MSNLQTFIDLLTKQNLINLLKHYQQSSEEENLAQLNLLYQQAQSSNETYDHFQELATRCTATKSWPTTYNQFFKTSDQLSFFTQALQIDDNFNQTDHNDRNVLHYLMLGSSATNPANNQTQPPFIYLRSMMLFESNQPLVDALCQRDKHNFTPFEIYLGANRQLSDLNPPEYTAALALIEIQNKTIDIESKNYQPIIKANKKLSVTQNISLSAQSHRLHLIATHFGLSIDKLLSDLT